MSTPVLYHEPAPALQARPVNPHAARFERSATLAAALFASDLSARCEHTRIEVAAAIRRAIGTHHGIGGCAAEVAAAYGEHMETAARRMRWACAVIDGMNASAAWPGASS
jgi:hypothetical protein